MLNVLYVKRNRTEGALQGWRGVSDCHEMPHASIMKQEYSSESADVTMNGSD